MHRLKNDQALSKDSLSILVLLLLSIFLTEMAVMELFYPLFCRLDNESCALLDAGIVVTVFAAPLWFFITRLLPEEDANPGSTRSAVLLLKALTIIFLVEYLVMLLLPVLLPGSDDRTRDLLDAFLTAFLAGVPLWWLVSRPKTRRRKGPLVETPLRLYVLLLCTIFLSDLLQETLLPIKSVAHIIGSGKIVDAFLTTLCAAPLLWFLVVRPLKRTAFSEQTRVAAIHAQVIDPIVTIDPQGVIRSFNPAAQRIFGYAAAEMIGASVATLFDEGERDLEALLESAAASAGQRTPSMFMEINCHSCNGLPLITSVSISEVQLEHKVEFLLIMRDITSRKRMVEALRESETRFRDIFDQSEDAILFFKPGGCLIQDVNKNAERIFGYPKAELQAGGLERICEPADLPALVRAVSGVAEGGHVKLDVLCRRKDGAQIVASLRGKVMFLQGAPVTYCTFRDITDRVRMEEKTRDIQGRLIQANKMTSLGLLVSGVAHEINNPNNFIMANSELLAKISEDSLKVLKEYSEEHGEGRDLYIAGIPFAELGEHSRRLIGGIAEGSHRVNDIVNNLKGFARQERNQVRRKVDVNQVARSAVSLLHHELIKFTDNFHLELAEQLPAVTGHGQQLGQVIINLLMNACQALHGKQGGIWLATNFDPQDGLVTITVRDEGRGIPPEDGSRVMEPFFTTKLDDGGTGLGLSISESIMKEHGGFLEFTSKDGRGTTFVVKLPAEVEAGDWGAGSAKSSYNYQAAGQ
jgi:PAS domain S-box-containing protein